MLKSTQPETRSAVKSETTQTLHQSVFNSTSSLGLMALEPRILLDAAGVVTGVEVAADALFQAEVDQAIAQMNFNADFEGGAIGPVYDDMRNMDLSEADMWALSMPYEDMNHHMAEDVLPIWQAAKDARSEYTDGRDPADLTFDVTTSTASTSIIFIDSAVADYQTIIDNIDPSLEVIVLDPDSDGVEQIAAALEGRSDLEAIHIISHGRSGTLDLGGAS